jgi:hypothetical protein
LITRPALLLQPLSCPRSNNSLQACYHVRHRTPLPQPARFPSDWQAQSGSIFPRGWRTIPQPSGIIARRHGPILIARMLAEP